MSEPTFPLNPHPFESIGVTPPGDDVQPPGDNLIPSRPGGIIGFVPGKSEAEKAVELKEAARKLIVELCALMDEGMRDGLAIRWANIAMNAQARHEVVDLHVQKRF